MGYSADKRRGFVIAAQTNSTGNGGIDAYLIKIDSKGKKKWAKPFGGPKTDRVFSVRETPDGGFVAAGITYSLGGEDRDAYLIKSNAKGKMEWQKSFGGNQFDVGHSVALTNDGGYLITGYGESFATFGKRDIYLIKTDGAGQKQWIKAYGGTGNDRAMKGFQTADGGYIAVGFTQRPDAGRVKWDVMLLKTDSGGQKLWESKLGERNKRNDFGYTVRQTVDGGYILTGQTESLDRKESGVLLIKTDSKGISRAGLDLAPIKLNERE